VLPIRAPSVQRFGNLMAMGLFFVLFIFLLELPSWPQQHEMPSMQDMPGMDHAGMHGPAAPEDPAVAARRLADKRESEFNHHVAGFLVALAGILLLAQDRLAKRWPLVRYAWPMCFLAAGLFLLVFSDTEIWPFGPQTPWYAITHNAEDLQHKTFAIILLALGYVEFQRTRGKFKAAWAAWSFPVLGMAGAILLLFHVHGGDMHAPHAMETMEHIQKEHFWLASAGFGIALTNGLSETRSKWQGIFKNTWPTLLIILGILLILYTE
jgi:putative copper resistance protein D